MLKNENGRSMVEMLGVLAIIGVLSVAGISGYTMAMKKYRTNEILNTASQLVILAQTAEAGAGGTADLGDLGLTTVVGYSDMQADCTTDGLTDGKCTVTTSDTPKEDWTDAASQAGTHYVISSTARTK